MILDQAVLLSSLQELSIVLGFLGEESFKRTSIPDRILLLLFRLLLGPALNIFSRARVGLLEK